MFKTLSVILKGQSRRAEEHIELQNAVLMIEQKLYEAKAGQDTAKRSLAALIVRARNETQALSGLDNRLSDLEARTRAAFEAGQEQLALDGASMVAELENERAIRQKTIDDVDERIARMRLAVEKTQRRIVDLQQGLLTARAVESERKAIQSMSGDISANGAIREGEAILERLLGSADPVAEADVLDELDADLSGKSTIDKMAEAGFGPATKIRAEDVLARFQSTKGA